jgi:predicted nucleic acid-binding protein
LRHVTELTGAIDPAAKRRSAAPIACEFFNVVTRKAGIDRLAAAAVVKAWSAAMTVDAAAIQDLDDAMRARSASTNYHSGMRCCG